MLEDLRNFALGILGNFNLFVNLIKVAAIIHINTLVNEINVSYPYDHPLQLKKMSNSKKATEPLKPSEKMEQAAGTDDVEDVPDDKKTEDVPTKDTTKASQPTSGLRKKKKFKAKHPKPQKDGAVKENGVSNKADNGTAREKRKKRKPPPREEISQLR